MLRSFRPFGLSVAAAVFLGLASAQNVFGSIATPAVVPASEAASATLRDDSRLAAAAIPQESDYLAPDGARTSSFFSSRLRPRSLTTPPPASMASIDVPCPSISKGQLDRVLRTQAGFIRFGINKYAASDGFVIDIGRMDSYCVRPANNGSSAIVQMSSKGDGYYTLSVVNARTEAEIDKQIRLWQKYTLLVGHDRQHITRNSGTQAVEISFTHR